MRISKAQVGIRNSALNTVHPFRNVKIGDREETILIGDNGYNEKPQMHDRIPPIATLRPDTLSKTLRWIMSFAPTFPEFDFNVGKSYIVRD